MKYVDGFVLVVPKKNQQAYKKMAAQAGEVWMEHGALEYFECVGEDLKVMAGCGVPFTTLAKTKAGEMVVFSFIVYKSRAHRDKVNAKVIKDPRMNAMMEKGKPMPFDPKRMTYGGFDVIVEG